MVEPGPGRRRRRSQSLIAGLALVLAIVALPLLLGLGDDLRDTTSPKPTADNALSSVCAAVGRRQQGRPPHRAVRLRLHAQAVRA